MCWMPANRLELAEERPCVEICPQRSAAAAEEEFLTDVDVPVPA